jgi:hypothetical protein
MVAQLTILACRLRIVYCQFDQRIEFARACVDFTADARHVCTRLGNRLDRRRADRCELFRAARRRQLVVGGHGMRVKIESGERQDAAHRV